LGLSIKNISNAHSTLSKYFNTQYPFANSSLKVDGLNIMFEDKGSLISADIKLQTKLRGIIEPFCETIDYGNDLMIYPKGREVNIVVDPHHQFGQPVIKDSNILAESIYRMYKANEELQFISELYEIDIKEVNDAVTFYQDVA
jgi:uncharacterized protein (DUF433 family)